MADDDQADMNDATSTSLFALPTSSIEYSLT